MDVDGYTKLLIYARHEESPFEEDFLIAAESSFDFGD